MHRHIYILIQICRFLAHMVNFVVFLHLQEYSEMCGWLVFFSKHARFFPLSGVVSLQSNQYWYFTVYIRNIECNNGESVVPKYSFPLSTRF